MIKITEKQLPVVQGNFEEVRNYLQENLKKFELLEVTEVTLSDSKAVQKDLAGLRTKIDKHRKEIKKEMSEPIKQFEDKCKELIELVESTERPIKEGIEVFNNKKRQENIDYAKEKIKEVAAEIEVEESLFTIPYETSNLTCTKKSIDSGISEQKIKLLNQKNMLENNKKQLIEYATTLSNALNISIEIDIKKYLDILTFDNYAEISNKVMQEFNTIKETQEKLKAKQEEEKLKIEQQEQEEEITLDKVEEIQVPEVKQQVQEETKDVIYSYTLKISGTSEELKGLKNYMQENLISFEVISKN